MSTGGRLEGEAILLRIHIGELDKIGLRSLYDVIVEDARRMGLAGATVIKGIESFGARSRIHTGKILRLSEDLPIIVEIADSQEMVDLFIIHLNGLFDQAGCGGMVTQEKVRIITYKS